MTERLVVVGGGTMGVGIAIVAARAGYGVDIVEPSSASRERATAYVQREAQRTGDSTFVARIRWNEAIGNTDASIAIEAVPEIYELKREVFVSLARSLPSEAILATNTSSLAVADLADSVAHPERVLGLHFFNPAVRMQLVEVVQGPQTGDAYLERALEFVARCGKQAVLAADTPGFIVNRVARPYYLEALRSLELGVATAEELDALARAVGFRMGPFELMDFIGLDVNLATSESVYARTGEERFAPSQLQREMVEKGLLGRKAGRGFYDYREASAARFEAAPAVTDDTPNSDERVVVVGFGDLAHQFYEALRARYVNVELLENDEFLENLSPDATMVVDTGPGAEDRGEALARLDAMFGKDTIFFVDAYATDLRAAAKELRYPERVVGYGLLGSLDSQSAVEIVDADQTADEALELAQEVFATVGKGVVLVEDTPGLFLGRTVGSIVNEAMIAVAEEVADSEDIDVAMRLGANYPVGPIAWGRQIGGARLTRILRRLADAEGERFAPHRSLWLLDVEEPATQAEIAE